jgi:MoxR-like ATPase
VRTLSEAVGLRYARVQCTPDLLPADVTGTNVLSDHAGGLREFAFQPGPLFANVVLADEINRATPRTQSAFLEAMQERSVTVFGVTHRIAEPFCVFATQNPIEMEGTYPLPEAQLDRFFFKIEIGMPGVQDLAEIMARTTGDASRAVTARLAPDLVSSMTGLIRQVKIGDESMAATLRLVRATHPQHDEATPLVKQYVRYGASPRGAQAIVLASKALALLAGRYHVSTADVLRSASAALSHRIVLNFQGEMDHVTPRAVVADVIARAGTNGAFGR